MTLAHKYVEGSPDAPVLLLLHGTGGSPDDLLGLARELSPDAAVLAPAGPVSEHGAARWFRRLAEGVFDHEDVVKRANELADFVVEAREKYGLGDRRLVAIGFSNGANIAAAVVLLRPEVVREAALFASMSPVPQPPDHDLSATRVFLANGERDPMAPLASTEELIGLLRERGADVVTQRHPGGHQITEDGVRAAARWITI
ncbi:alpha/beta hydrolase [Amycolatopsis sp. OK19-0408]|uniref:Alpha/beta hydrolase n=1 Tax=Amycolatopsis iheyensis TaxID=2945988 RepID=A0A9X2SJF1_9PSEU|nr:alpha/beta hydrolase [Amycolatopsis iheyensis]MCR6484389.1 alpha/beta hydrolase [Amycolatopsis iheyensis]